MVEMRVPVADAEDQQYAWITRPEIAQPLTDAAMDAIGSDYAEARAFALLASQSTHCPPRHLARRREVTDELTESIHLAGDPGSARRGIRCVCPVHRGGTCVARRDGRVQRLR
jgi:hypothetical protein